MLRDLKHKETLQLSLSIQNLKLPFFLHRPKNINLQNWTSQTTYRKCRYIYMTSNLSHKKCGIFMRFYLVWMEYNAIWNAPIGSPQLKWCGGARLLKITILAHSPHLYPCRWTVFHRPNYDEPEHVFHYNIPRDFVVHN